MRLALVGVVRMEECGFGAAAASGLVHIVVAIAGDEVEQRFAERAGCRRAASRTARTLARPMPRGAANVPPANSSRMSLSSCPSRDQVDGGERSHARCWRGAQAHTNLKRCVVTHALAVLCRCDNLQRWTRHASLTSVAHDIGPERSDRRNRWRRSSR